MKTRQDKDKQSLVLSLLLLSAWSLDEGAATEPTKASAEVRVRVMGVKEANATTLFVGSPLGA